MVIDQTEREREQILIIHHHSSESELISGIRLICEPAAF
jgi:hypothetical protein